MNKKRLSPRKYFLCFAAAVLTTTVGAQDFAAGVQARHGNTAPTAGASHVDDYLYQDEQINVLPTDGVVRVLRTNQKNLVNDYVTEAIPIQHALISEILHISRVMTAKEGGWAEVMFNKADGTNHVSVVCPPHELPYLRDAITKLDKPYLRLFDDGSVQTEQKMRHRPAAVVAAIADGWAPFGSTEVDVRANKAIHSDEAVWSKKWHAAANMIDFPVHEADLDITIYEVDTDAGLRLGLDYIAWKNGPGQTLFDVMLAGHDSRQTYHNQTSIYDYVNPLNSQIADGVIEAGSKTYSASANYLLTAAYVDFLATKGRARVVNSSTLRVTSGHSAELSMISDVLAFQTSPSTPTNGFVPSSDGNPLYTVHLGPDGEPEKVRVDDDGNPILAGGNFIPDPDGEYVLVPGYGNAHTASRELDRESADVEIGVSLDLFPSIALESMELEIDLSERSVTGISPNGTPIVSEFNVYSEVRLADGQPFVLSGLRRSVDAQSTAKVPILGSLPVVGYLFGGENNAKSEKTLVAVIVPRFYSVPPNPDEIRDDTQGEYDYGRYAGMASWAEDVISQAEGNAPVELTPNMAGFDQWILDGETF